MDKMGVTFKPKSGTVYVVQNWHFEKHLLMPGFPPFFAVH